MKNKRLTYLLIALVIMLSGVFIIIKVNQYRQRVAFTQEKWFSEPNKRFVIVKDMIKKYNFGNMTKKQVINLLGIPDGRDMGGVPVRTYEPSKPVDLLRNNQNSVYYLIKGGQSPEDFNGFYLKFDINGKVIDYAIIHFTT